MSIPASAAREKLFPLIQEVNDNSTSVLITSKNGNAILLSQSEYERMIETLYLFSTPANAKATLKGIQEAKSGKGISFNSSSEALEYFKKNGVTTSALKKARKSAVVKKKVKS